MSEKTEIFIESVGYGLSLIILYILIDDLMFRFF